MPIDQRPTLPLAGIRVLDIGTFIAGPCVATFLGDFGAEVIKVEQPGVGDPLRSWGTKPGQKHSPFWGQEGRNKLSITCNLRHPEGQRLIRELAGHCDIVIESFRPGTLERWQLGFEHLQAVRPDIILVRVSGYGQTGPNARKPGFARVGQAFGGLTFLAGEPGGTPLTPGSTTIADYVTPLFAALGAMIALRHRDRTGEGQIVDASLFESTFRILDSLAVDYGQEGYVRQGTGRFGARYAAPHGQFQCRDGSWIALACTTDKMWQRFCRALGREDLAGDERFATTNNRLENREQLHKLVDELILSYEREQLLAALDEAEVAAGPVYNIADIFADPHYRVREAVVRVPDPVYGTITMAGIFPKLSRTPGLIRYPGRPYPGADNEAIYTNLLKLNPRDIEKLAAAGVI